MSVKPFFLLLDFFSKKKGFSSRVYAYALDMRALRVYII